MRLSNFFSIVALAGIASSAALLSALPANAKEVKVSFEGPSAIQMFLLGDDMPEAIQIKPSFEAFYVTRFHRFGSFICSQSQFEDNKGHKIANNLEEQFTAGAVLCRGSVSDANVKGAQ